MWAYRDGGKDILEAERCNLDGAIQQQGDHWPDGGIPGGSPPLLNHECSDSYDSDLHKEPQQDDVQAQRLGGVGAASQPDIPIPRVVLYLGWSKDLTRSTKHSDMNALRRVSVLKSMVGALVLAEASCCVVCLPPVSSSDAAEFALI